MKIKLLTIIFAFVVAGCTAQCPDFTATDCDANIHNLYSELSQGKVIVVCWVMPCGGCIIPAVTTHNVVQSYQASHPNTVYMYLCEDYGDHPCSVIENWAITNGISQSTRFSDANLDMLNYGSAGMPKIVVFGNAAMPTVYYNVNITVDSVALQNAIDAALAVTGTDETASAVSSFSAFPNPANTAWEINFHLKNSADVTVDLFNLEGRQLGNIFSGKLSAGENKMNLDLSKYSAGMYLVKITEGIKSKYINISISH